MEHIYDGDGVFMIIERSEKKFKEKPLKPCDRCQMKDGKITLCAECARDLIQDLQSAEDNLKNVKKQIKFMMGVYHANNRFKD